MSTFVENNNSPIFIVGAARSGTTLLQYMLRSHPDISLPTAESHFFIPFYKKRNSFGDLEKEGNIQLLLEEIYQSKQSFFDNDVHGIKFDAKVLAKTFHQQKISTLPEIISGIFLENAHAEDKKRWGDKTPYYILHLDTILEMFPDAQIIHLIRDGRDCAISMLERKWDLKIFNTYHAAYIWDRYVTKGKNFGSKHPESYFEIRYEDILNQPEASIKRLCDFLKIEFNDSVINFKKSDGSGKTALLTKPLKKSNQAKWKSKMTKKQLAIFESLAGNTLKSSGYELTSNSPSINKWNWFINEVHIKLCYFYSKHFLKK